jgi:hypothetical protein
MNIFQLSATYAAFALATAAMAAPVPSTTERGASQSGMNPILARESEPGDDHHKGRGRATEEQGATTIAREASEGPRGEGKGHKLSEELPTTVAREASEGPRGEGKGHPVSDEAITTIAREASEGPRGEGKGHPVSDEPTAGLLA